MFELFFLGFFFTFWNYIIGRFTVAAFTRLFREGCGGYLCILLWPHWIVGIIFPPLIGMTTYTLPTAILLIAVTCALPYTYWIVKFNYRPDDENDNYRTMPCCSCLCKDSHRTNLEKSIICKRVIDGGSDDDDDDEEKGSGFAGRSNDDDATSFRSAREEESIVSYRAKHPKSDIVKKRKKHSKSTPKKKKTNTNNDTISNIIANANITNDNNDDNDNNGSGTITGSCNDNDDDGINTTKQTDTSDNDNGALSIQEWLSFPVALPAEEYNDIDDNKMNLYDEETPCIPIRSPENNSISNNTDDDSISQSELVCSICLEEYNVGDEIAYSKNDECHHAFHKDCIIDWLVNHKFCPICRKKY